MRSLFVTFPSLVGRSTSSFYLWECTPHTQGEGGRAKDRRKRRVCLVFVLGRHVCACQQVEQPDVTVPGTRKRTIVYVTSGVKVRDGVRQNK